MPPVIAAVGAIGAAIGGTAAAAGPLVLTGGALYGGFGGALAAGATLSATLGAVSVGSFSALLGGTSVLGSLGSTVLSLGLSVGANILLRSLVKTPALDLSLAPAGVQASTPSLTGFTGGSVAAPQSVQSTFKQTVGPRVMHYGRVKIGGQLAFLESKEGKLYSVVALSGREISGFVQHWLNAAAVSLDGSGFVTDAQYVYDSVKRVQILPQTGTDSQTAHSEVTSAFPTLWASTARGLGVANVLTIYQDAPSEGYRQVYPQGAPTYRAVVNGCAVYDPRDSGQSSSDSSTWQYSTNPALCVLDYLTHADGMGRARSLFDEDSFAAAADVCDEQVSLKAGGTETRYLLSGSLDFSERPVDVLSRMLSACDGELFAQADGTWGMRVGKWYSATKTLDDSAGDIISYRMEEYVDALSGFNLVKPVYVSASHDYQETQAEAWVDSTLYGIYGEYRTNDLRLHMVPSPSQARRLAKIAVAKGNPQWSGTVVTPLSGLGVFGEASITLKLAELDIDQTFKISGFRIGADLTTCEIDVLSLSSAAYDWDPATEEGTAPPVPPDSPASAPPSTPTGFSASSAYLTVQAATQATVISASWTAPTRDSLIHEINYKRSTDSQWASVRVPAGTSSWQSSPLEVGVTWQVRLRALSLGGTPSDWTSTSNLSVTDNPATTDAPAYLDASKTSTLDTVTWINPNNGNFGYAVLYAGHTTNFAFASEVVTINGGIGASRTYLVGHGSATTNYYWVRSYNTLDIAGGLSGPV